MCSILDDLDVEYNPGSKARLLSQLNNHLIEQIRVDKNVVLIIDEAQNLTPSVLEEVRMLSNLETDNEKLLQIIFLGQPELKKKLALNKLEQLRQRIAVFYHLSPLDFEDTKKYILHRLKVAGAPKREYFTDEAICRVYAFTKGVPRMINQICDSALLSGFIDGKNAIDAAIIEEVIQESPTMQIKNQSKEIIDKLDQIELEDLNKGITGFDFPESSPQFSS